jgi:choline-glycine betaine transporter
VKEGMTLALYHLFEFMDIGMLIWPGCRSASVASALQTASIAAALPFVLVMLIMTLALIRGCTNDPSAETR